MIRAPRLTPSMRHQTIGGSPSLLLWLCMQRLMQRQPDLSMYFDPSRLMPLFDAAEQDQEAALPAYPINRDVELEARTLEALELAHERSILDQLDRDGREEIGHVFDGGEQFSTGDEVLSLRAELDEARRDVAKWRTAHMHVQGLFDHVSGLLATPKRDGREDVL